MKLMHKNVPSLGPHASLYAGSAAAEPCARGHSFVTGARCDPRAAQRAALSQRMYRGLAGVARPQTLYVSSSAAAPNDFTLLVQWTGEPRLGESAMDEGRTKRVTK